MRRHGLGQPTAVTPWARDWFYDTPAAGSRKSPLAMAQTWLVIEALRQHFEELQVDIEPISTQGDERLDVALSKVGDKGLFVKELETALLEGRIDFAIHSMKDMPGLTPWKA
ncbi:MAG: hypothetical protein R2857_06020 [Vampirovibrionales bacterium]